MKKLTLFLCAVFLIFCAGNAFATFLPQTEYPTDLSFTSRYTDNVFTDGEEYSFLGGIWLDPGHYDLTYSLYAQVNGGDWDAYPGTDTDVFYIKSYLDGGQLGGTSTQSIEGASGTPIVLSLDVYTNAGFLELISYSDVSASTETWGLISANLDGTHTAPVPEPATMLLLGCGMVALAGFTRRKFKK
jgi:hypothetical protein